MSEAAAWDAFARELDAWASAGRRATFWWRDDDATRPSGELDRLLALTADQKLVIALAVIPFEAGPELAAYLSAQPVRVFAHGWRHRNLAPAGRKKSEFPEGRPHAEALADLAAARERIGVLFGALARPVLTPPWNRIDPGLPGQLAALGYRGLSAHGVRAGGPAAPGLAVANTHLDPIDWRGTGTFVGTAALLGRAGELLARRRQGEADATEPCGLLTHHLRHDQDGWTFVERFLRVTAQHPGVRWIDPDHAFGWSGLPEEMPR
ncbi:MAG: polysaccharide deacetylase family protein [Alphaproteobacteria bacterium]|nr:polysaccharide deacetylase family protein [Alphaproteobacteria bacterium]